jgi:hypothetical protein
MWFVLLLSLPLPPLLTYANKLSPVLQHRVCAPV